jgi:hypothetical protein
MEKHKIMGVPLDTRLIWERMQRLIAKWIPMARVCHPYPLKRFGVTT